jgi:hypothetical protein
MVKVLGGLFTLGFFLLVLGSGMVVAADVSGRVVIQGQQGMIDVAFGERDRYLIREYYGVTPQRKQLPPGLAKQGKLPPGIRKQLMRQGQLPPDVRYKYFPRDLERQLTRLPDGYARVVIGGSFALIDERTRVVSDVIHDFD